MKHSVCALVFRESGKILGVSRKDDPTSFGLIGGKVEPGETLEEALIRETKEETGLHIVKYRKIFERIDNDEHCTTFLCSVIGEIKTRESGVVKEVTWEELFNGPFGEYNHELYNTLNKK